MYRKCRNLTPVALVLAMLLVSPALADWSFIRGDCNGDDAYDISDPIKLLDELFLAGAPVPCDDACDADDDGMKLLADCIYMLDGIFGVGELPPAPFGGCGTDPTDDSLGCAGPVGDCLPLPPGEIALIGPPRPSSASPTLRKPFRPGEAGDVAPRSVLPFSGEFAHDELDMEIPGRGFDFKWARSYRSRVPTDGQIGNGWDYSYNISIEEVTGGLLLHDGSGRVDLLTLEPDGVTYARDGFFYTGLLDGDGVFTLTFANQGTWVFNPLLPGASAAPGKIATIADRNGNSMTFAYDGLGNLTTVTDTLGREVAIDYTALGKIATVTDFTGRVVSYDYYAPAQPGGNPGDLRSKTTPAVLGTPNGNDYPLGKTTFYSYSSGFADSRLNSNLLTITDPRGLIWLENTYGTSGVNFDRVARQNLGSPVTSIDLVLIPNPPEPEAVAQVIVNDRRGLVTHYYYDASNRLVIKRQYTGLANPTLPTTNASNLPINPLRGGTDPLFFETRYEWNADSRLTRVTHPNGNITDRVYELDLDPMAPRHARGNLRELIRDPGTHSPIGDQPVLVEMFEYETGFGGNDGVDFHTRHVDARGNETLHQYDSSGNRIQTTHRIPSIVEDFEYNNFGQLTAHLHPSNGSVRRRDEISYYASGPQTGYMSDFVVDAPGLALTTQYSYDDVGNRVQAVDPNGNVSDFVVNSLNQVVREVDPEVVLSSGPTRYQRDFFYDANDNRVRMDVQNVDETGALVVANAALTTLYEYDLLNNVTRICREKGAFNVPLSQLTCVGLPVADFLSEGFEYDRNENRSLILYGEAMSGAQSGNRRGFQYDERDLLWGDVMFPGAASSTTQYDYDGNGNVSTVREGIENSPRVTLYEYDAYDRLVRRIDAMGNEVLRHYDANGNVVNERADGEAADGPGNAFNIRLAETDYGYDPMDRLSVRMDHHFETAGAQPPVGDGMNLTTVQYVDTSQFLAIIDDNNRLTSYSYDSANRLTSTVDPAGNSVAYAYDGNSNVTSSTHTEFPTAGGAAEVFMDTMTYDGLDRLLTHTDNLANTRLTAYDSRGNSKVAIDAKGNVVEKEYDGVDRLLTVTRVLTSTGDGGGVVVGAVVTSKTWDDTSRLVMETDDNNNGTSYGYDPMNRVVTRTYADSTTESNVYDVHHNVTSRVDANGSLVFFGYDDLNRNVIRDIVPGPGVSMDTTFELYEYDGLSRLVRAEDDDAEINREYDSMSNATREDWPQTGGVVTRGFDGVGNELALGYPSGRAIEFSHDELNRKSSISDSTLADPIASYEYVGPGRVSTRSHGNGTVSEFQYDGTRRTVATSHAFDPGGANLVIDDRIYSWDPHYNKTRREDVRSGGPGLAHDLIYDSLHRLSDVHVVAGDGTTVRDTLYVLDGVGNRLEVVDGECNGIYSMNAAAPLFDRQMNQYTTTGCDLRSYDSKGNLINRQVFAGGPVVGREFDYRDQLVLNFDGTTGINTTYSYDPLGRLISVLPSSPSGGPLNPRTFFYDDWQIIEEQDDAGTPVATYVYGNGIDEVVHLEVPFGGQSYYYHCDDLGNVMALTDLDGVAVERYEYSDFGTPSFFNGAGSPLAQSGVGNPYLFTGRRYDASSGLYYYRTRFLDSAAGRFITRDAIGIWGDGGNLGNGTTYVGNNPWTLVDPMGLASTITLTAVLHSAAEPPAVESGGGGGSDYQNPVGGRRGLAPGGPRFFNGLVSRFQAGEEDADGRRNYRSEINFRFAAWAVEIPGGPTTPGASTIPSAQAMLPSRSSSRTRRGDLVPDDTDFGLSRVRGGGGAGSDPRSIPSGGLFMKESPHQLQKKAESSLFVKSGTDALFKKAGSSLFVKSGADTLFKKAGSSLFLKSGADTLFKKAGSSLFLKSGADTLFKKASSNPLSMKESPSFMKENPFSMKENPGG